jgi:hypothetical protein
MPRESEERRDEGGYPDPWGGGGAKGEEEPTEEEIRWPEE